MTEAAVSPWRTRRDAGTSRADKLQAVLAAAARLFVQRGFHRSSLDDIAASLQVTKPTLYYYVDGKEPLLAACIERGLHELRSGLERLWPMDAAAGQADAGAALGADASGHASGRERLRQLLNLYAEVATSDFGLCAIRVGDEPLSEPRRKAVRALRATVDEGIRTRLQQAMHAHWLAEGDAAAATLAVVGALNGVGRWYQPGVHTPQSLADAVRHSIEMLMRGVLGEPARPTSAASGPAASAGRGAVAMADRPPPAMRLERHFGQRVVRCFAERPASLARMLARALRERPDGEALVCEDLRMRWRDLHHAAARFAGGLAGLGIAPGDRVALLLPNGPELVVGLLGCAWRGAVSVPIGVRASAAETLHTLQDSGSAALVAEAGRLAQLPGPDALPALQHRIAWEPGHPEAAGFGALMAAAPLAQPHDAGEDDLAVLLYTSGTTGHPKGSMVTQLNLVHSALHMAHAHALTPQDRTALAVPAVHATGLLAQLFTFVHVQGTVVLMRQFKAADFARLVAAERITHTVLVPAMYHLLLLLPDLAAHDLSSWRVGAYGGAPMPATSIDALAARLPGVTLANAYGATETASPASLMPLGQTPAHRDSIGLAVPCADIHIADDAGRELPRGAVGEIWVAGPMVVPGYWRNPEATAREFCGGYWRSGDIGRQDAAGWLHILDRKKDVVNRGGYKIYGIAVENAMAEHPQVIESALVGVPCPVLGERGHLFVCVRRLDEATTPEALAAFCAQRLPDYSVPETWTIGTEPLPRNAGGKLQKRQLRQQLQAVLS